MDSMERMRLVKNAAKAAGHGIGRWDDLGQGLLLTGIQEPWNPLDDDGDALRLAVALRIDVSFEKLHTVSAYTSNDELVTEYCDDGMGFDIADKTRMAIVRAAASLTPNV